MTRMTSHKFAAFLAIFFVLLLSVGCTTTGTSVIGSTVLAKPSHPIKEIRVVYLESTLKSSDGMSSWMLDVFGYKNLPEQLRERVPLVFGMNNIVTDYATNKTSDGDNGKIALNALKWTQTNNPHPPILVLQVINGFKGAPGTMLFLNLRASLYNPSDTAMPLSLWAGQFRNTLRDKVIGSNVCLDIFDSEFVDQMLKTVLEQMAKDGIVTLPGNTAKSPTSLSENKCKYVYATLDSYNKLK